MASSIIKNGKANIFYSTKIPGGFYELDLGESTGCLQIYLLLDHLNIIFYYVIQ